MATVILRAPLSERCGGRTHELPGASVVEVVGALELAHPDVKGWILDELGAIRPHVNVFVNGIQGDATTPVADSDRLHILPSITGG